MTREEFMKIAERLNVVWPGKFPAETITEWNRSIIVHEHDDVDAAITRHFQANPFPPALAEILQHVQSIRAARVSAVNITRTQQYLAEQRAAGVSARQQVEGLRRWFDALPSDKRTELLELTLETLDREIPALASHFYTRKDQSPVVLARAAELGGLELS